MQEELINSAELLYNEYINKQDWKQRLIGLQNALNIAKRARSNEYVLKYADAILKVHEDLDQPKEYEAACIDISRYFFYSNITIARIYAEMANDHLYPEPASQQAQIYLAEVYTTAEMYKEAITLQENIADQTPQLYVIRSQLADNYAMIREYDAALKILKELIFNDCIPAIDLIYTAVLCEMLSAPAQVSANILEQYEDVDDFSGSEEDLELRNIIDAVVGQEVDDIDELDRIAYSAVDVTHLTLLLRLRNAMIYHTSMHLEQ
jgi:predicted Zn-dependent protease